MKHSLYGEWPDGEGASASSTKDSFARFFGRRPWLLCHAAGFPVPSMGSSDEGCLRYFGLASAPQRACWLAVRQPVGEVPRLAPTEASASGSGRSMWKAVSAIRAWCGDDCAGEVWSLRGVCSGTRLVAEVGERRMVQRSRLEFTRGGGRVPRSSRFCRFARNCVENGCSWKRGKPGRVRGGPLVGERRSGPEASVTYTSR